MGRKSDKLMNSTDELLKDLLIVQLSQAGLTQHQIREVLSVDIHRVNRMVKYLKRGVKKNAQQ